MKIVPNEMIMIRAKKNHNRGLRRAVRRYSYRRGTAVVEFVLAIPFLAFILGITFFFGWALMHKQKVMIADRYSAWQRVETGSWPGEDRLNNLVFNGRAADVNLSSEEPVWETADDLVNQTGQISRQSEMLADELVLQRFPAGHRAHVAASFDPEETLWQRYTGAIHHRYGREGITWRRAEVSCWLTLRDFYYADLDAVLERMPAPANRMAQTIRSFYLASW